jgi:acetolactate synthase small subunit
VDHLKKQGKCLDILEENKHGVILRVVSWPQAEPVIFQSLKPFEIIEVCRTGKVTLSKKRTFGFFTKQKAGRE